MKDVMRVISNGNKNGNEAPDPIELLIDRLWKHPLEDSSQTFRKDEARVYWGNFKDVSAVFNIEVRAGSSLDKMLMSLFRRNRRVWPRHGND